LRSGCAGEPVHQGGLYENIDADQVRILSQLRKLPVGDLSIFTQIEDVNRE
jgi:hypothetical protein